MQAQKTMPAPHTREHVPLPRPRPQAQAMTPAPIAKPQYPAELWERARRIRQLPPPEYDKPYEGKLTITRARDKQHLAALCRLDKPNIACAWPRGPSCEIIMVPDEMIVADGFIPELVLRHEQGHCNSWPKDHPNQRALP